MSFSATIEQKIVTAGRTVLASNSLSGGRLQSLSESIADSETDKLVNFAVDVSQITALLIKSDQALTIETNDGSSPDDTLVLVADVPYVWHTNSYDTCKFTTDITKLYVTNASGAAAQLEIECLSDPTP